jgi:hypothetical protein
MLSLVTRGCHDATVATPLAQVGFKTEFAGDTLRFSLWLGFSQREAALPRLAGTGTFQLVLQCRGDMSTQPGDLSIDAI